MKNLAFLTIFLVTLLSANAQNKKGVTLTVTIENVLNSNGSVLATLHSSTTFAKNDGTAIASLTEKATKGKVVFTFENVEPGTYALILLHDENDNKKMDFATNGMPKENYGVSNNPMLMGPPNFNAAKFDLNEEDLELRIRF